MDHLSIENFNGYPLQGVTIDNMTAAEIAALTTAGKYAGRYVYNTTVNKYYYYNGATWIEVSDSVVREITATTPITVTPNGTSRDIAISAATTSTAGSMSAADKTKLDGMAASAKPTTSTVTPIDVNAGTPAIGSNGNEAARADHKHGIETAICGNIGTTNSAGTSTSLTRADHVHALAFSVLNSVLATANAAININGQRITGSGTPTSGSDLVTKDYAEMLRKGIDAKEAVRCVATTNITLSGLQTIDTVTVVAGDRVGVVNQTDAKQNGIYIASATAWSRSDDANSSTNFTSGLAFSVTAGSSSYIGSSWVCTTADPITLGTTSLTFVLQSGAMMFGVENEASATGTGEVYSSRSGNTFYLRKLKAGGNYMTIVNSGTDILISLVVENIAINNLAGTLAATKGGTGLSSLTQGDILYASATNTLAKLAKVATASRYLANTGTSNNPAWAQVNLANGVTGTLPVANGGTGGATAAAARTALSAVGEHTPVVIGDGVNTVYDITHTLNTQDVIVKVSKNSGNYAQVMVDNEAVSASVVRLTFGSPPATNAYRVLIHG